MASPSLLVLLEESATVPAALGGPGKVTDIINDRQHMLRKNKGLLIGVVVVVGATIACFKLHEARVKRQNSEKLANLIQISVAAAGAKNQQAVRMWETEINTILAQQFPEVAHQGRMAAEDIASYGSCCKIIYFLARDKIKSSNSTADFVDERMQAHMEEPLRTLSGDLDFALDRFEQSLKESTVCLARELAQINPLNSGRTASLPVDLKSSTDLNQALRNLGLGGTTIGVSIPPDVWLVLRTKIVKSLASKAAAAAGRMFARPAAAAATEVAIAEVPIADIITLVAGLWTAYDVYSTQKQFESEMKASIDNMMPQVRRDIQKQATDHVHSLLKEHERLQDEIRQRSAQEFAK